MEEAVERIEEANATGRRVKSVLLKSPKVVNAAVLPYC